MLKKRSLCFKVTHTAKSSAPAGTERDARKREPCHILKLLAAPLNRLKSYHVHRTTSVSLQKLGMSARRTTNSFVIGDFVHDVCWEYASCAARFPTPYPAPTCSWHGRSAANLTVAPFPCDPSGGLTPPSSPSGHPSLNA